MGKAAKAQFIAEQKALDGEDWNYVIGGSSPWVDSYTIEERENAAMITYTMQDSEPAYYTLKELLKFGEENGKTVVAGYLTSNLYWEDGKVHPTVSRTESDLDEGIWDFLSQSVVGFISQSGWDVFELEAFNFNRISVTRTPLSNGREQVTVDFGLNMHYRNPFRDPDEAGYIKRAKEAGQSVYAVYYKEYYEEKEGNTYFRFTCEVQADAQKINEDTCYPETFHLYNDDFDPHRITFYKKNPAWDGWYDETPTDGWFCTVTPAKGRTNNGYFDLNLDYTTTLPRCGECSLYRWRRRRSPCHAEREGMAFPSAKRKGRAERDAVLRDRCKRKHRNHRGQRRLLVEEDRLICRYSQGARTLRASFSCAILMTFQKVRSDCNEDNLSAPQRLFR